MFGRYGRLRSNNFIPYLNYLHSLFLLLLKSKRHFIFPTSFNSLIKLSVSWRILSTSFWYELIVCSCCCCFDVIDGIAEICFNFIFTDCLYVKKPPIERRQVLVIIILFIHFCLIINFFGFFFFLSTLILMGLSLSVLKPAQRSGARRAGYQVKTGGRHARKSR